MPTIPLAAVDDIAGEDTSSSANTSTTLGITCAIYFSIMALGWLYFDCARRKHRDAYAARNRSAEYRVPLVEKAYCFMGWIASVIRLSDEEVMEYCGLDTLIFLRFQRLCGKIAACGVFCSIFLFPIYATAPQEKNVDPETIDILQKLSLGNVMASDSRLYASIFASWALSLLTMYLIYLEYQVYVNLRHEFLQRPEVQQYSVLIHNLPLNLRTNAALKRYMDYLFPHQVRSVAIALEVGPELEKLVDQRCLIRQKLEHAMTLFSKTRTRPRHRQSLARASWCQKSHQVDSIEWYQTELETLNDTIASSIRDLEQRQLELDPADDSSLSSTRNDRSLRRLSKTSSKKGPSSRATSAVYIEMLDGSDDGISDTDSFVNETTQLLRSSGFVSYTSIQAAQMSQQVLQTAVPNEMDVEPAPAIDEVIWPNVGMPLVLKKSLQCTSTVLTTLIVLFWTIPTTAVVLLSSVSSLKAKIPSLDAAVEAQPWLELVIAQIGPLALVGMNALAPIIFAILSRKEGHCAESTVQASLFTKLCLFELVQIFFVASISGSILDSLSDIIDQPSKAASFLGASIPGMASFFMGYIVIQTGLTLTLELLRVVPRVVAKIHDLVAPRLTPRERNMPWMGLMPLSFPGPFEQTNLLADHFLVVLLIITYGPISPLVCYFGTFGCVILNHRIGRI